MKRKLRNVIPRPFKQQTMELTDAQRDAILPHLVRGNLFQVVVDLCEDPHGDKWAKPLHPYLVKYTTITSTRVVPKGTLVVYMGPVKVEESNRERSVRVTRHSFLVGDCQYIIQNLPWISPVV